MMLTREDLKKIAVQIGICFVAFAAGVPVGAGMLWGKWAAVLAGGITGLVVVMFLTAMLIAVLKGD